MAFDRIKYYLDKMRFYAPSWILNRALRILGGKTVLADYYLSRTLNVGISYSDAIHTFKKIRSLEDWIPAWYRLGLKREAMARKAEDEKRICSANDLWMMARAAYYIAQFPYFENSELKDKMYSRCAEAYRHVAPRLYPPAMRLEIPFRTTFLPAYLRIPEWGTPEICLIVIGGIDGVKEESHYYSEYFVRRGFSVLTFDCPGTGEAWLRVKMDPDYGSVAQAIMDYLSKYEKMKFSNFGVMGLSLGGNIAIHFAADGNIGSCVAVSPPFEPHLYFYKLFFIIRRAAQYVIGGEKNLDVFLKRISLKEIVPKVKCPLFVIGGGMDAILPGEDALKIHELAPEPKKIAFYEDGTHVCPEYNIEIMGEIEKWFRKTLDAGREKSE
jgi:dienelactone hydrolase